MCVCVSVCVCVCVCVCVFPHIKHSHKCVCIVCFCIFNIFTITLTYVIILAVWLLLVLLVFSRRALIGASIFISTVVFGSVILLSPVNRNTISGFSSHCGMLVGVLNCSLSVPQMCRVLYEIFQSILLS